MVRNVSIIAVAVCLVALPFLLRPAPEATEWQPGDPELVIITPHNEAVRYEFDRAFAAWHRQRYGTPVRTDWRMIGGGSEIMRYLEAEFTVSFRAWWRGQGHPWPPGAAGALTGTRFPSTPPPDTAGSGETASRWELLNRLRRAARETDDPRAFSTGVDLLFGGGEYDHSRASRQGFTVAPWPADAPPPDTVYAPGGALLMPTGMGGETWRTETLFGAALSTFGICYNLDRIRELGAKGPPRRWSDLADPVFFRQLGAADPTKSGSIAKAFEMIIHQQVHEAVREAGYDEEEIERIEAAIAAAGLPGGELPGSVPASYREAVSAGWLRGVRLVQRIGANARYFTDSASKVPIDVSTGDAAAGLAIDFYGRYQAELSKGPDGAARMAYVTPAGGSSVSADPISLLRGAPRREVAVRFMTFVLSEEGQRLWNYRPGAPGGPAKFALRRLPVRRDYYPSEADPQLDAVSRRHAPHVVDALSDPAVNPYALAGQFTYRSRWTAGHFSVHRDLIRAMCLDAGEELRAAWAAIIEHGGPSAQPEAVALMERMPDVPEPLTWARAPGIPRAHDRLDYMREWTLYFRHSYREAADRARQE